MFLGIIKSDVMINYQLAGDLYVSVLWLISIVDSLVIDFDLMETFWAYA